MLALLKAGRCYEDANRLAERVSTKLPSIDRLFEFLKDRDERSAVSELIGHRFRKPVITDSDVKAIKAELFNPSSQDMVEQKIMAEVKDFVVRTVELIRNLNADRIISEEAINPLLVKALGFKTLGDVARYYVYQTLARSIVTSFGSVLEKVGRLVAGGKKAGWWDAVVDLNGQRYFMSIKSGPRTMDADQAREFVRRAKEVEAGAKPVYVGLYGKELWSAAKRVIENELGSVDKHVYIGKSFYEKFVGKPNYHARLLTLLERAATSALRITTLLGVEERNIMELVESKVAEVTRELEKRFKDVDELVLSLF